MINATLYSFSKTENSTRQPSGGTTYTGELKEPCSTLQPSISFRFSSAPTYNYMYLPTFNRYYYVNNWIWEEGRWTTVAEVDSMASWKSYIGAAQCYVLRSASTSDGNIIDSSYNCTAILSYHEDLTSGNLWDVSGLNPYIGGWWSVGVVGSSGVSRYYLMDYIGFGVFSHYIFSDTFLEVVTGDTGETIADLKKSFNALDYITSIIWIPSPTHSSEDSLTQFVSLGWWSVPKNDGEALWYEIRGLHTFTYSWDIPRHPLSQTRGNYLNLSPYSSYSLIFPPFGIIELPAVVLANSEMVLADFVLDERTGDSKLIISTDSRSSLIELNTRLGVDLPLSRIVARGTGLTDYVDYLMGTAKSAINLDVAGGLKQELSFRENVALNNVPTVTTRGGQHNGASAFYGKGGLIATFFDIEAQDLPNRGAPLCQIRTISTLPGYNLVAEMEAPIPCTGTEYQQIKSYMEGGFLYE